MSSLPDGLDALREVMELAEVMRLIEQTARWVDPATFELLPVWYPEFSRQSLFYKADWSEAQPNTNKETGASVHKQEGNTYANRALTRALGLQSTNRPNWSCCHIWGVDDPRFQSGNEVVRDSRFYSCIANMVLLPTPLKAFTDAMPEVKAMLRICSRAMYGWACDHESVRQALEIIDSWTMWEAYPASWPRLPGQPNAPGVVPLNPKIRKYAVERAARIRRDLETAGNFYPRATVKATLEYWSVDLRNVR